MSLSAQDIFERIMENAVKSTEPESPNHLPRFHVSQTADQLPDIRKRNAFYRAELEKQINDKREAERKRKEREAFEEERLLRKIEADREKLKREYFEELRQRELMQEEAARKHHAIARKLEEIQEAEERKREEEIRKRQLAAAKRIADLEDAMEKKRLEELEKKRLEESERKRKQAVLERLYNWDAATRGDFVRNEWDSREYVNSALGIESMVVSKRNESCVTNNLDDMYYNAPLSVLADVYRRLVYEKSRIKEVIKERISDGES